MNKKPPFISVVIPVFNEENIIDELILRLSASIEAITDSYELLFVNDGSKDATLFRLEAAANGNRNVRYLSLSRNFGHQIAVSAGIDHCCGDIAIIIDGDLQDPPELIPELYAKYCEGFKVVYAKRKERKGESWFKKITAKGFYRILNRITDIDIPLDTGDFRLIDKDIVLQLRGMKEPNKFLRGQIAWMGYSQTFVEFSRDARKAGKTGYPLKKMIRFALDGITGFSNAPLKFVTNAGIFVSLIAFLVILYALYSYFVLNQVISGWTSLIVSMMFIGGIQLVAIGIIGEYISRINNTVRNRPLYIIESDNIPKT